MSNKQKKLEIIAQSVAKCKKCKLYKSAINSVPGSGNSEAQILLIGEAPGAKEDTLGLPFVGNSGKLLDKLLALISVNRSDVFICNILKHRPPNNRDPLSEEIKVCTPYLKNQLQVIEPKVIITLGRFAMNYFFPLEKISNIHGKINKIKWHGLDLVIIPVYHPFAGLCNGQILANLQVDFKKIRRYLETIKKL